MSNRIDFFQPTQTQLALPAAAISVLIDGEICPCLEVVEIVRGEWPEFSKARLRYNPSAYTGNKLVAIEGIEAEFSAGRDVRIEQIYNAGKPDVSICNMPVFTGQIEAIETRFNPDGEQVEIIARDFSANLERITVYGRWTGNTDGSAVFLGGVETVFNEGCKGNATIERMETNGNNLTLFASESREAKLWSYSEVIEYMLRGYLPKGQLEIPSIERLRVLTEGREVRELDVTGLSLIEALHRCCSGIDLKFKFVPRLAQTGAGQAIIFYKSAEGRTVELNCQQRGEQLSISKTNISVLHSRKNFWPITHKYIGQGDFKIYESTFELIKAWDPADESADYDRFSPLTNPDFYKVRNVYRKWCLNEAGDYSAAPYNQGEAFDFSKIFEGDSFIRHRRRFWPTLTADKQGNSLGYFLQVSFDNGLHWWPYIYAFDNLPDECGIWLSSDQFDADTWLAASRGELKFRITASVISDERLSCTFADGPVGSTAPVVENIITLPRQFKYRKVNNISIFANVSDSLLGKADEADDSTALFEFVRRKAAASSETIGIADVQTPYLILDYQIGDKVTSSPESRDLLGCKTDSRSIFWIERVQMDFEKQCSNLRVVRRRT
jgi:hypothetical protein